MNSKFINSKGSSIFSKLFCKFHYTKKSNIKIIKITELNMNKEVELELFEYCIYTWTQGYHWYYL